MQKAIVLRPVPTAGAPTMSAITPANMMPMGMSIGPSCSTLTTRPRRWSGATSCSTVWLVVLKTASDAPAVAKKGTANQSWP